MVGSAGASTISVDFHGVTQTTTLTAADIAGVVPATTWNPAFGNNNFAGIPVDAPTLVGAATVGWASTGSAHTSPNSLATPDHQMMEGYLTGSTNAARTISPASVRVTGLNLPGLGGLPTTSTSTPTPQKTVLPSSSTSTPRASPATPTPNSSPEPMAPRRSPTSTAKFPPQEATSSSPGSPQTTSISMRLPSLPSTQPPSTDSN